MKSVSRLWILPLVCACCWLIATTVIRVQRLDYVSGLPGRANTPDLLDSASPTGLANGQRELIMLNRNNDSYHWIAQTQQMLAQGSWSLDRVDYDNAPFGRACLETSPYRWALGSFAVIYREIFGGPLGLAVERAAVYLDPLLHLLLLVSVVVFTRFRFGAWPSVFLALGWSLLYPLATEFAPGAPNNRTLFLCFSTWMILSLLAWAFEEGDDPKSAGGPAAGAKRPRRRATWALVSGVCGGLALWTDLQFGLPLIAGVALGALVALAVDANESVFGEEGRTHWRLWALAGALVVLAGCAIEGRPQKDAPWELKTLHPFYGIVWLALVEIVVRVPAGKRTRRDFLRPLSLLATVLSIGVIAVYPWLQVKFKTDGFLASDPGSNQLAKIFDGAVASSWKALFAAEGVTFEAWVSLFPCVFLVPAILWCIRRSLTPRLRAGLALALGPALVAAGFASVRLGWGSLFASTFLALLIPLVVASETVLSAGLGRLWLKVLVGLALVQGVSLATPPFYFWSTQNALNEAELIGLVERDLAHWLARHTDPKSSVVLAPPKETNDLFYYGGLRGLGTLAWGNEDGIGVALRILSASTPEEAKELIDRRGVTHILMPSWDTDFDTYATIGMGQVEGTFLMRLKLWKLTPWLKPVVYKLPTIDGFEGQRLTIFEVVEEQEPALAFSRVAEYFLDLGALDAAAAAGQSLRRYPADLGAWVARAQIDNAQGNTAGFEADLKVILGKIKARADRELPLDQRVSLAAVLYKAKQDDLCREQVRLCLEEVSKESLRSISTNGLYRMLVLAKQFNLKIKSDELRLLALDLLPADARAKF